MAETFQFELVTPERLAVSQTVSMVEVPGEMGDFGVLAGHAPFFSMIRSGVVTVHPAQSSEAPVRYFVPSGYAEVSPESCTLLVEQVRDLAQITRETAQEELLAAKNGLDVAVGDHEKAAAEHVVRVAQSLMDCF